MFLLTTNPEYYDDMHIVSNSRAPLEELALSLFEEDCYEWFCILNENEPPHVRFANIMAEAAARALNDSKYYYNIVEAIEFKE